MLLFLFCVCVCVGNRINNTSLMKNGEGHTDKNRIITLSDYGTHSNKNINAYDYCTQDQASTIFWRKKEEEKKNPKKKYEIKVAWLENQACTIGTNIHKPINIGTYTFTIGISLSWFDFTWVLHTIHQRQWNLDITLCRVQLVHFLFVVGTHSYLLKQN